MAASPHHQLNLVGLVSEHMGLAAWNADGTGLEPERELRSFDTPIGTITHHTYAASPDYGGIDPQSTGGLKVVEVASGFTVLTAALEGLGADLSQVTVSIGPWHEAPSEFHHSADHLETRTLVSAEPTVIRFDGRAAVELPTRRMLNRIDWNVTDFFDSVHYSEIEPVTPHIVSGAAGDGKAVGEAMLEDIAGRQLIFSVDDVAFRLDATFSGQGRHDGILVDLTAARMWVAG